MLEFSRVTTPTARKEHKCDLCGRPIMPGEKYVRYAGKADGYMFDTKNHTYCWEIIGAYCEAAQDPYYDDASVLNFVYDSVCALCPCEDESMDFRSPCVVPMMQCEKVRDYFKPKEEATTP